MSGNSNKEPEKSASQSLVENTATSKSAIASSSSTVSSDDKDLEEFISSLSPSTLSMSSPINAPIYKPTPKPSFQHEPNVTAYDVIDLNKAPQIIVDKAKKEMSVSFENNRIKPTDAEFVFDKQVEFDRSAVEPSDWDE